MKRPSALINFLNLSVGQATDAYLRELALVAIQSRQLTRTVEQLTAHQRALDLSNSKEPLTPPAEPQHKTGNLIERRYFVANDGTVTDQQTKLMWMQNPLEARFTFDEAEQAAKRLNSQKGFAGHKDWRVPSQEELYTLISKDNDPPICQKAFPNTPRWFWSSTSSTSNTYEALIISLTSGASMSINKSDCNHVRLVR